MKHITIFPFLFLFIFTLNIQSQTFDQSFLESLPEDVAKDLIERADTKAELEEPQYRRPSTFVNKPEVDSKRFGSNIFSMMQSTLMPINEPNFDNTYALDFGDELELQLIGQKTLITKLPIKRDGSISIPEVGKLFIAGLPLKEASNLIKNSINESFIGVEAFITLTNVRDIQVIVAGNVYNPGSYTLNGNSNIFHALSVSGGPSEIGSFRQIDLIRKNEKIETIDLYDIFMFGKPSFNVRLRSGDIVFINPIKISITSKGAFNRAGLFELKENEDLDQIIKFSNGLTSKADINNISLDRIINGSIQTIKINTLDAFADISGKDGDAIFVREYPFKEISITGEVKNPGTYLMSPGDSFENLIERAGGFTKAAYIFGAVYENEQAKKNSDIALKKLYNQSLDNLLEIVSSTGNEFDITPMINLLGELKNAEASGRIIVDLSDNQTQKNLLLEDSDKVFIPVKSNQVYLYGATQANGSITYKQGEDYTYYVDKKGGLDDTANLESIYVVHPNGVSTKIEVNKNLFKNQSQDIEIYPGSIIYIPERLNDAYSSRVKAQAYATILGNIAMSIASISVLK